MHTLWLDRYFSAMHFKIMYGKIKMYMTYKTIFNKLFMFLFIHNRRIITAKYYTANNHKTKFKKHNVL